MPRVWVCVTCDVPFMQYGLKHSGQSEYVPTRIKESHVRTNWED